MKIYDILADNYSDIFPLDPSRSDFVLSLTENAAPEILDLGCATGDFCIDLLNSGASPSGIDLNKKMIKIAKDKSFGKIIFHAGDMLNFRNFFPDTEWDAAACFGNTLPHLPEIGHAVSFFTSVFKSLKTGGSFTVQVLNYDFILKEKAFSFPLIETGNFTFTRKYDFLPEGKILFTIRLTDNSIGQSWSDSTELLPIGKEDIKKASVSAGFRQTEIYSGYDKKPALENSPVLLYVMTRI